VFDSCIQSGFVFTLHSLQFVQAKNLVKFFWTSCKQEFNNQDASFNTRNVSITETSSQFSQSIFCLPFFQLGISALWNRTSSCCGNLRLLSPLLTFFTCYGSFWSCGVFLGGFGPLGTLIRFKTFGWSCSFVLSLCGEVQSVTTKGDPSFWSYWWYVLRYSIWIKNLPVKKQAKYQTTVWIIQFPSFTVHREWAGDPWHSS
jgi:hypothetical protein